MKFGKIELEIFDSDEELFEVGQKRLNQGLNNTDHLKRQKLHDSREQSTTNVTSNEISNLQPDVLSTDALIVRGKFPQIVMHQNNDEENWKCDICCSKYDEDED